MRCLKYAQVCPSRSDNASRLEFLPLRVWFDGRLGGYRAEHHLGALASSMDDDELVCRIVAV